MLLADCWGAAVLYYMVANVYHIPAYAGPLVLIVLLLTVLFIPFNIFSFKARVWFMRIFVSLFALHSCACDNIRR